eukprot:766778-Hanusia_phi.AAC.6
MNRSVEDGEGGEGNKVGGGEGGGPVGRGGERSEEKEYLEQKQGGKRTDVFGESRGAWMDVEYLSITDGAFPWDVCDYLPEFGHDHQEVGKPADI